MLHNNGQKIQIMTGDNFRNVHWHVENLLGDTGPHRHEIRTHPRQEVNTQSRSFTSSCLILELVQI